MLRNANSLPLGMAHGEKSTVTDIMRVVTHECVCQINPSRHPHRSVSFHILKVSCLHFPNQVCSLMDLCFALCIHPSMFTSTSPCAVNCGTFPKLSKCEDCQHEEEIQTSSSMLHLISDMQRNSTSHLDTAFSKETVPRFVSNTLFWSFAQITCRGMLRQGCFVSMPCCALVVPVSSAEGRACSSWFTPTFQISSSSPVGSSHMADNTQFGNVIPNGWSKTTSCFQIQFQNSHHVFFDVMTSDQIALIKTWRSKMCFLQISTSPNWDSHFHVNPGLHSRVDPSLPGSCADDGFHCSVSSSKMSACNCSMWLMIAEFAVHPHHDLISHHSISEHVSCVLLVSQTVLLKHWRQKLCRFKQKVTLFSISHVNPDVKCEAIWKSQVCINRQTWIEERKVSERFFFFSGRVVSADQARHPWPHFWRNTCTVDNSCRHDEELDWVQRSAGWQQLWEINWRCCHCENDKINVDECRSLRSQNECGPFRCCFCWHNMHRNCQKWRATKLHSLAAWVQTMWHKHLIAEKHGCTLLFSKNFDGNFWWFHWFVERWCEESNNTQDTSSAWDLPIETFAILELHLLV